MYLFVYCSTDTDDARVVDGHLCEAVNSFIMRKLSVFCLFCVSTTLGNIVINGGFDSGELPPWRCHGDCQCDSSARHLGTTVWSVEIVDVSDWLTGWMFRGDGA